MPRKSEKLSPMLDETKNELNSINNSFNQSMNTNSEIERPNEVLQVNDTVW